MDKDQDRQLYKEIGWRISKARKRKEPKFFQADLARALGVTRASVSNIERGDQRISIALLYEVTNILGVKLPDLLPPVSEFANDEMKVGGKTLKNVPSSVKRELQGLIDEK